MTDVNVWAILLAAVSVFVLGGAWYSPMLFGEIWKREAKMTTQDYKGGHKSVVYGISFVLSLISAYALAAHLGPQPSLENALFTGGIVGIGWVATSFGINYSFAMRSLKLFAIDGGYHVFQFLLYGLILGLWH